jgi:RNA polymerase sigma-70 factor (ECF subfamily)
VQDVFLKIWLKRKDLPGIDSFSSYLFKMLRNETYDWLSKQARQRRLRTQMGMDPVSQHLPEEEDFLQEQQYAALLQQAIAQLPTQQQQVFRMMRLDGFTREQTAITLKIDSNTVKTHMSRALKNIRAWCLAHKEFYLFLLFF